MLDYLIVIPARLKSSRLPGKPLKKINGKELVLHVLERCSLIFDKKKIVVATDSIKIQNFVKKKKFNSILTSKYCLTGTDRVSEVSKKIKAKMYINVQGDEPLINPKDIQKIISEKKKFKNDVICGMTKISDKENPKSLSIPKVIFDKKLKMIYMSRSLIPGKKTNEGTKKFPMKVGLDDKKFSYWKQVCIYAFSKQDLKFYGRDKKKSYLEKIEDIEILRFLDFEKKIKMVKTSKGTVAVDYPRDIKFVEKLIKKNEKR
tara:strand:+ start:752 stop:1531 length:780 start_codon:yes stop_codon:yes gene_type:complete